MNKEEVQTTVQQLKRRFHSLMNGPVSESMRQKGLAYKVNFGVALPHLLEVAREIGHDAQLAQALWQEEDIRECRLLATMVQPAESFEPDLAELWVERIHYPEEAEYAVMYLFQHLPYASDIAFEWMASENQMVQLCGFLLIGRLFAKGQKCNERSDQEFLDQAHAALKSSSHSVSRAAAKALEWRENRATC